MKRTLTHTLGTFLLAVGAIQAQQVDWNNNIFRQNYYSDGTSEWESDITLEIGVFSGGFTPTADNVSLWDANWVSLDSDPYNPNSGVPFYGANAVTYDAVNLSGAQVHLWGYNDKASLGTPTGEGLLITSSAWSLPGVPPNGQPGTILSVAPSGADEAILGQVNHNGVAPGTGTDVVFEDATNADANFELQSASWAIAPIPEPSSTLLLMISGLAFLRRHRE